MGHHSLTAVIDPGFPTLVGELLPTGPGFFRGGSKSKVLDSIDLFPNKHHNLLNRIAIFEVEPLYRTKITHCKLR